MVKSCGIEPDPPEPRIAAQTCELRDNGAGFAALQWRLAKAEN
jgi:hypothetical protein